MSPRGTAHLAAGPGGPGTADDRRWMCLALKLASRGVGDTHPNPPVGAVVVRGGSVVGSGYHRRAGLPHAEVYALRKAGPRARGATLYVTLEPCCTTGRTPPCTEAILRSGIRRVVVSVPDPNPRHNGRGLRRLRSLGVATTVGVCREEGEELIRPFAKWIRRGLPYVTLKLGMALDGRIADRRGSSRWITCAASRRLVQQLRRGSDAVLIGGETARADNPSLLVRAQPGKPAWRVVLDSRGRLSPGSRILTDAARARTIVATTRACPESRRAAIRRAGADAWTLRTAAGGVSLADLMSRLGRMGVLHVLCEGGGTLAANLVNGGWVDEVWLFVAPTLLGGSAVPAFGGAGWLLGRAPGVRIAEVKRVGADVLLRGFVSGRPTCSRD